VTNAQDQSDSEFRFWEFLLKRRNSIQTILISILDFRLNLVQESTSELISELISESAFLTTLTSPIDLSPEFQILAGAVIGWHKSVQTPSILVES
jgi:hypothetical protein